ARLDFSGLDRAARSIAAALQSRVAPGERALLLHPPGLDYLAAFFGCLYAGVVAVPAYPPRMNRSLARLQSIVEDSGATAVLTTQEIAGRMERIFAEAPRLRSLLWMTAGARGAPAEPGGYCVPPEAWRAPDIGTDSLAFLQYTSGSTASPRGVMVTHGN